MVTTSSFSIFNSRFLVGLFNTPFLPPRTPNPLDSGLPSHGPTSVQTQLFSFPLPELPGCALGLRSPGPPPSESPSQQPRPAALPPRAVRTLAHTEASDSLRPLGFVLQIPTECIPTSRARQQSPAPTHSPGEEAPSAPWPGPRSRTLRRGRGAAGVRPRWAGDLLPTRPSSCYVSLDVNYNSQCAPFSF